MGDRSELDVQAKGTAKQVQAIAVYLDAAYGLHPDVDDLPEGLGSWHDDEMSLGTDVEIANWLDTEHPSVAYMIHQGARYEYNGTLYLKTPSLAATGQRFTATCDNESNVILTEDTIARIDAEATDDGDFRQGILKAVGSDVQLEFRDLPPKAPWVIQWEQMLASTPHPTVP